MGPDRPAAWARSRSLALSVCKRAVFSRSKTAKRLSAALLTATEALAIKAEAALAC